MQHDIQEWILYCKLFLGQTINQNTKIPDFRSRRRDENGFTSQQFVRPEPALSKIEGPFDKLMLAC
jgi:hypothetical protein